MKEKLRIGVVGAGCIANNVHFQSLVEINGIELAAVCDLKAERAESSREAFGFKTAYTNHLEMFENENLDGVFLLVQPDQIFRLAVDALEHEINVFVEKPAGLTLFQTESLARLSKKKEKILQVGMNRRYIPLMQTILSKLRAVTEITQVEGCFVKHGDASFFDGCGSAYICDTIHAIDIISYIADSKPQCAATVISQTDSPVANSWNSVMKFENGITGILKANYNTGGRVHSFEIIGPDASAYIDIGFGGEICKGRILYRKGAGTFSISSAGDGGFYIDEFDGIKIAGSDKYYRYYGYYYEDEAFIKSIKTGEKSVSDIEDSVKSMRLAEFLLKNVI